MPIPPPQPIDFEDNTDAIALQSTLSILAMQKQRAEEHIRLLAQTKNEAKANPEQTAAYLEKGDEAPWKDAFKPQSIARSPNINWDKYAIVGESLDKIAKEQATHPPETRPSVWADGKYQEQPEGPSGVRGEEYKGVFSPVSPFEHQKEKEKASR